MSFGRQMRRIGRIGRIGRIYLHLPNLPDVLPVCFRAVCGNYGDLGARAGKRTEPLYGRSDLSRFVRYNIGYHSGQAAFTNGNAMQAGIRREEKRAARRFRQHA